MSTAAGPNGLPGRTSAESRSLPGSTPAAEILDSMPGESNAADWLDRSGAKTLAEAWQRCPRVEWLLSLLEAAGYAEDRVYRRFACRCVREVWDSVTDVRSQASVKAAEQYADGRLDRHALAEARAAAWDASHDVAVHAKSVKIWAASRAAAICSWDLPPSAEHLSSAVSDVIEASVDASEHPTALVSVLTEVLREMVAWRE